MIQSLALIFSLSIICVIIANKLKLPNLLFYIFLGYLLQNFISQDFINLASFLRQLALIIILLRAGLSLKLSQLKTIGLTTILLSFIPASLEIIAYFSFTHLLLQISIIDSLLLGSIIAAVSPAIIVPRMIKLINNNYGTDKLIPQTILASASLDDIFVIVLFSIFLNFSLTNNLNFINLIQIPLNIIISILIAIIIGFSLKFLLKYLQLDTSYQLLIFLSISFILIYLNNYFNFSALLSIMLIAIINHPQELILNKLNSLWQIAEIILFTLVGLNLKLNSINHNLLPMIILIFIALIFRSIAVLICVHFTNYNLKEKLFTVVSFMPKATVQAAIAAIPLQMGISSGNLILQIASLSIIITASIGAILIDNLYSKLLKKHLIN